MTETTIVVATESGHCRAFRHMDDAHVFADQLIAGGEQVLLTVADPLSGRYSLHAMVPIDYEDEIRGWDRACRGGRSVAGSTRTAHPTICVSGGARAATPYTTYPS